MFEVQFIPKKMIQDNEVVMLLLGMGGLWFVIKHHNQVKRINGWFYLLASFFLILIGWTATILEAFFLEDLLNLIEHSCYSLSAIMLFVWSWKFVNTSKPLQ